MSRKVRFMLALVMLTLFLGSGAAHALPSEARNADQGAGMLVAAWEWLASLFEGGSPFLQAFEATGEDTPPPPGSDGGGFIDPNG